MITKYTRETLKEAIEDEDFMYDYTTHIADKLRAIYTLFGWVHMLKDFDSAQNLVDRLMNHVYSDLIDGKVESSFESAGLRVEGWFDEDGFLNIDYYFSLN